MLKLLIVDDEEEIRKGIAENVDWEANGIVVCGEADNGDDAMLRIAETEPDILLIDVRMPGRSGLQVVELLQESGSRAKSIILSGYDDFSYAQQALKSGASDYLLKPCRSKDILEAVLKVKREIQAERSRAAMLDKLQTQYRESLPLIKEKFLQRLLHQRTASSPRLRANFDALGLSIGTACLAVIAVKMTDLHPDAERHSYRDVELMKYAVKNIVAEVLQGRYESEICEEPIGLAVLVHCPAGTSEPLVPLCESMDAGAKRYLGFSLSFGIGNPHPNIEDLRESYGEALQALEFSFLTGDRSVFHYRSVPKFGQVKSVYPVHEEKKLLETIAAGAREEIGSKLEAYWSVLVRDHPRKDHVQTSVLALFVSLHRLCLDKNVDPEPIFGPLFSSVEQLIRYPSIQQIKAKLHEFTDRISAALQSARHGNRIIMTALKYMEENYDKNLTLELVAGQVYVNPKYLSMLFKQTTGENFVDYIQSLRVEKACELLRDIRLRTYEVANRVGYADEKYFSHIFKKLKGMPPSQYRDLMI